MADKTDVANMALFHIGVSNTISNIDTERTTEARVCKAFFDQSVDEMLRDFCYPDTAKYATLQLISSNPNNDWGYSYSYPNDCLMIIKILGQSRVGDYTSRVPYDLGYSSSSKLIYTDQASAVAKYIVRITDVSYLNPDLISALSYKLALYIAPTIASGENRANAEAKVRNMYIDMQSKAAKNALNEIQEDREPEAENIRLRDGL